MLLKIYTPFIVLIGFGLFSCSPASQYETELNEIDSHLAYIDSLEVLFDGIDFDSLNYMVEHVKHNESDIKKYYSPDTLDSEFGHLMTDAKSVRKTLSDVMSFEMSIGDELNAVKHQFMDLKEDILAGIHSEEQIKEYLSIETLALNKVDETFSNFYVTQKTEKELFYKVVPKIDSVIIELKTKSELAQ